MLYETGKFPALIGWKEIHVIPTLVTECKTMITPSREASKAGQGDCIVWQQCALCVWDLSVSVLPPIGSQEGSD